MKRTWISLILVLVVFINCFIFGGVSVFAHSQMLDIRYDNCIGVDDSDGVNEMWYLPYWDSECYHLSHETTTLKYYFATKTREGLEFG